MYHKDLQKLVKVASTLIKNFDKCRNITTDALWKLRQALDRNTDDIIEIIYEKQLRGTV